MKTHAASYFFAVKSRNTIIFNKKLIKDTPPAIKARRLLFGKLASREIEQNNKSKLKV